jgi:DNA mismatch endonuclease (patch repair protein)
VVAESTRRSMKGNTSAETKPEVALRKALWSSGLRGYRKNVKTLPGRPDVVFGKARVAVFVHGCFWHGCPTCTRNLSPRTNSAYWQAKIEGNRERDARNEAALTERGYTVLVLWECDLTKPKIEAAVSRVRSLLLGQSPQAHERAEG